MLTSFLYSLAFILFPDPQTPNFYSGLASAREASKKSQKEMVIFFSDKTCTTCEAAWVAFTKDVESTKKFISTRMNRSDFDGGVFFDLLELQNTPSWVILHPDGTEKERWEGEWKNESGNIVVQETKSLPKTNKVTESKNETVIVSPGKPIVNTSVSHERGFFLQAGYFGSEVNAKKMLDDLKSNGINSFEIKPEQTDGKPFYRVVSKMFATEAEANNEQQRLSSKGFKASVKS